MTANLLTLSSSQTELLLVGLKKQKRTTPQPASPTLFTVLASSLTNISTFSDQISSLSPSLCLQIKNSLARAVLKDLKSCHTTTILCSLHWLKTTERIEYKTSRLLTKSSQPPNLHTGMTSSLFNLIAALALHLSSLSLDHQHHPRYVSSSSQAAQ